MAAESAPDIQARQAATLETLIEARGIGRHALFFAVGEGTIFPDGTEEESGYAIDERGRVFAFWTAWDARRRHAVFESWEEVEPEADWVDSPEYRRARRAVGLG